jgi:GNAT superfamily N-acetyltransferase
MIRLCAAADFTAIRAVINDGAEAYRGAIPADCMHDPYMSDAQLAAEIAAGVVFAAEVAEGRVRGVMGMQDKGEVALIRHAYVATAWQRQGIGAALLDHWRRRTPRPILIGTWAAARWAVNFYTRHGFVLVPEAEKNRLLAAYWTVPPEQVAHSVVLADHRARSTR